MSANHVLLQRLEVSNSTSTVVSFRNIPQTGYTDLKIVVSGRTVRSGTDRSNDFLLTFNDNASGYSRKDLGDSAVRSTGGSSLSNIGRIQMPSDDATANTFGNAEIYIANYTSSQNKAVTIDNVSQDNNTYGPTWLVAGLWSNSSPISSISLTADQSGTITAGSTFSLYGIAKLGTAPQIAPKAFGGDIIANDGEYWYHAFLTTGAFKPKVSLNCDALVIAGGGGGGYGINNAGGGGGGAGGVLGFTSLNLSAQSYVCTVGAGGAGNGSNGTNSQFGSLTEAIGGGGGGGGDHSDGNSGGSGGGGRSNTTSVASGTSGQGFAGGAGNGNVNYVAGGGGGAGGVGINGTTGGGGNGGPGTAAYSGWLYATNTGVAGYIAGGGGASSGQFANPGNPNGGSGGGGQGGFSNNSPDVSAGTANTGSGGGGEGSWSNSSGYGGAGGSGIVIVRYAMA